MTVWSDGSFTTDNWDNISINTVEYDYDTGWDTDATVVWDSADQQGNVVEVAYYYEREFIWYITNFHNFINGELEEKQYTVIIPTKPTISILIEGELTRKEVLAHYLRWRIQEA